MASRRSDGVVMTTYAAAAPALSSTAFAIERAAACVTSQLRRDPPGLLLPDCDPPEWLPPDGLPPVKLLPDPDEPLEPVDPDDPLDPLDPLEPVDPPPNEEPPP
jgi:hypothetical protein